MPSANLASEVRIVEQASNIRRIDPGATTTLFAEGIAERGPIGTAIHCQSLDEWKKAFGDYTVNNSDVVAAMQGYFDNGGVDLWFSRIVHTTVQGDPTTKTSAPATATLLTAATSPTPGQITSAVQPFNITPGQVENLSVNGGATQAFTFNAAAASKTSGAGNFNIPDQSTLQLAVNGGSTFTKTFSATEFAVNTAATPTEVKNSLNAFFAANGLPLVASVVGSTVVLTTNQKGTGASINIVGGTANGATPQLAFPTGTVSGTGDAANIAAMTAAEVVTKLSTLTSASASAVGGAVQITTTATGTAATVQNLNSSTATALGFDNAIHAGSSGVATNTLTVNGKTDGTYGNSLSVQVAAATNGAPERFNLFVIRNGVTIERFFNLTLLSTDPLYAPTVVNDPLTGSDYIALVDLVAFAGVALSERPANGTFGPLTGGNDGLAGLTDNDYVGGDSVVNGQTGFSTFNTIEGDLLIVPGRATSAVHNAMITYAEVTRGGLLFCIFDPPANQTADQIVTYVWTTASIGNLSDKAAIYWPRIKVANPNPAIFTSVDGANIVAAPSGHVAGIYASRDQSKIGGAFEQPAGTDFAVLRGIAGFETKEVLRKPRRDVVFPKLINPLSQETGTPMFVDGARTLKNTSPFPSVGQRRGVIFVEKKLKPGLAFLRHQNINDKLYRAGERAVDLFLVTLTENGCFKSLVPSKAFTRDFGAGLNPPSVQAQNMVVARIGLATSNPAEFIQLIISPDTRALDTELAALVA